MAAIVIIKNAGNSGKKEEIAPPDSTDVSHLINGETINVSWAAKTHKENSANTHPSIHNIDNQASLNRHICPVLILKRKVLYIELEVHF